VLTFTLMWLGSPIWIFLASLAAIIIPMTIKSND
jgi:hypothetical protein